MEWDDGASVLVGFDGSAASERALRWAVHEAASRGGTVRAVTAYTFDNTDAASLSSRQRHQETVEQMLGRQVVTALANDPRVAVTTRVVFGNPTEVLLDSARDATLLVLGSHGHGRLFHAVLGSVAEAPVFVNGDEATMQSYVRRLGKTGLKQFNAGVFWVNRQGVVEVTNKGSANRGLDVSARPYFSRVLRTGKPYVSAGLVGLRTGRRLLVLDTASPAADRIYRSLGWIELGVVPDFALLPAGGFCDTTFFWKRLA